MIDLLDILNSWRKVFLHTPEQEAEAERRLEICKECQFLKGEDFPVCGACGCPLKGKVYTGRNCPIQKW
jgi:uncharacterized paraquat-inducible protein A